MMTQASTGTGSPPQGPTVGDAASAFEALLSDEDVGEQGPEEGDAEADEAEASAGETEADPAEDTAEDSDEDEPGAEDEEGDEGEEPAGQSFTVKVDGTEQKVTLDELLAGYSRTSDYTRKTQAVAEERKSVLAEKEAIRAERAEYAALLPKLKASLEAGMGPEPNWAELRKQDPVQAAVLWQQREEARRQKDAIESEESRVREAEAAEQKAAFAEIIEEQKKLTLEKIPEWKDQEYAKRDVQAIRSTMTSLGFEGDELRLIDHRVIQLARKAALYDSIMSKKPGVKAKAAAAPVVRPGAARRGPQNEKLAKATKQLQKTGSVRDAASVFANFLD